MKTPISGGWKKLMSDPIVFSDSVWEPSDDEQSQNRLLRKGLSAKSQCNRTVCTTTPAPYLNYSTKRYYCEGCAKVINRFSMWDHGVILCKLEKPKRETMLCDCLDHLQHRSGCLNMAGPLSTRCKGCDSSCATE